MELADHTWTDADATDARVALLPIGSTEQHGPHAPLGTDTILAETVAKRGAATSDQLTVIAPAIPIGIAEEHRAFSGTLWLSPNTVRKVISETVSSLAAHGWDRVVLVNGHGGNVAAIEEIAARLTRDGVARCVPFTWFDAIDLSKSDMGHGGQVETSALLAVDPSRIRSDRLEEATHGAADRWGKWVGGVNVAIDTDEFSQNGVVGNPAHADEERGNALLDEAAEKLAAVIEEIA